MPYSIDTFCERYGFSRGHYYNLKEQGKTPREMKLGRRKIITDDAATDWEKEREAENVAA